MEKHPFEKILIKLRNEGDLTTEITQDLNKIFSIDQFMLAMEKIALDGVKKYVFQPSNREIWIVDGKQHDYFVYPMNYCSCLNFFRYGIGKNQRYFCKHLIAQAILENLSVKSTKISNFETILKNSDIFKILKTTKTI